MTNLEKMLELVNSNATKAQVKDWAYMNRIMLDSLSSDVKEMKPMNNSVNSFMKTKFYNENILDEYELWDKFLDSEYKE